MAISEKFRTWRKNYRRTSKVFKHQKNEENKRRGKRYPAKTMFLNARNRAKAKGIIFTLKQGDVVIPTHCPVLGIPLFTGSNKQRDNSPSLDRFIPNLGYVPGNIAVISHRANRIKNDATVEEIEKILTWMRQPNSGLR